MLEYLLKAKPQLDSLGYTVNDTTNAIADIQKAVEYFVSIKDAEGFQGQFEKYVNSFYVHLIAVPYSTYYKKIQKMNLAEFMNAKRLGDIVDSIYYRCYALGVALCSFISNFWGIKNDEINTNAITKLPDYAKSLYKIVSGALVCMLVDTPILNNLVPKEAEDGELNRIKSLSLLDSNYYVPYPNKEGFEVGDQMVDLIFRTNQSYSLGSKLESLRVDQIDKIKNHYMTNNPNRTQKYEKQIKEEESLIASIKEDINAKKDKLDEIQQKKMYFKSAYEADLEKKRVERNHLTTELESLGLFKVREKKELKNRIESVERIINELYQQINAEKHSYWASFEETVKNTKTEIEELEEKKKQAERRKEKATEEQNDIPLPPEFRPVIYD